MDQRDRDFENMGRQRGEWYERLTGSLWLVTVPGAGKYLGAVYRNRIHALEMRGPAEMVVELRLADSAKAEP